MHYSEDYCSYVLDPNAHLEQVDVNNYQDQHLQQYVQMQPQFHQENQSFLQDLQTAPPPPQLEMKKKSKRHAQHSPEAIDDIALNSFKGTTKRQTVWGVNVFRGMYLS